MNSTLKEAKTRAEDLTNAIVQIGKVAADTTIPPKDRLQRVLGICALYEAVPRSAPVEETSK